MFRNWFREKKPYPPPGEYVWVANGVDIPVTVTGYLGEVDGVHYVSIDGSSTGVPAGELKRT